MALRAGPPQALRAVGGGGVMDAVVQFQADLCGIPVVRAGSAETTAVGAAYLAGLATGLWSSTDEIAATWQESARFVPGMPDEERQGGLTARQEAVNKSLYKN